MGRKWCENNRVHKLLDYNWQVLSLPLPESFQDQSSGYLLRVLKGLTFVGFVFFPELEKNKVYKNWGLCFFTGFPPNVWDSVFFSELKPLDYSRTNFLLFAGARVLDTQ